MPFCPNCRIEYVAGTNWCADCGRELVAQLQPHAAASDPEATRPAELCEVKDLVEMDLIEAQLRAAGIPTVRRPRNVALFVPAARLTEAQQVMAGHAAGPPSDTVGLSELHRIRLACSKCDQPTVVDLLTERVPMTCACGHMFDLSQVIPILDRYADVMRLMANTDYEIEIELPKGEE
jgi:hypothetical protein